MAAVEGWQSARPPRPIMLAGRFATLRPPEPEDAEHLYRQFHDDDPRLWDYMPYGPFNVAQWDEFWSWCPTSEDPRFFVVTNTTSGVALGYLALLRADVGNGSVEVGHVLFSAAMRRTPMSTEAIYLASEEALMGLRNRRCLEWKCDSDNQRSRRAAERFGFRYEGTFRQHMVVKGRNRDSAWFSIIDAEWPLVSEAVRAWLSPENFDRQGRQIRSLEQIRSGISTPR